MNIKTKTGRPTIYSSEIVSEICHTIASSGKGTKRLCKENPHWPSQDTIFTWLKIYPEFSVQYAQAKRLQVEVLVDEILEIADDASKDTLIDSDGVRSINSEHINRSRLRIDSRKWLAAKLAPRIYGDKVFAEHGGDLVIRHEEAISLLK